MGQHRWPLIALVVCIVGIVVTVGILFFRGENASTNRNHVVVDLEKLAAIAQKYYKEPSSMNGGARNFLGFALSPGDTGNMDGSFSLSTQMPTGTDFQKGSTWPISQPAQYIYIIGSGKVTGNDNRRVVKAYALVTPDSVKIKVMN